MLGDPDQLRRALRNVLDNAERHAASEVSVSVQEIDETIEVVIADDGTGIPAEHRDRIFERFARIDDARTRDGASTGLGLAITREIVEAHGGDGHGPRRRSGACFVLASRRRAPRDRRLTLVQAPAATSTKSVPKPSTIPRTSPHISASLWPRRSATWRSCTIT